MDIGDITMQELFWAIKKLKRGKAAGPDCLPIDCYKEMNRDQLHLVLDLMNGGAEQKYQKKSHRLR